MPEMILVVPCYNEAERLPVDEFIAFTGDHTDIQFLFVNDGSTDATLRRLETLHNRAPDRCHVHNMRKNSGKAEATRTGMLLAFEKDADYVGFCDADLATPLAAFYEFRQILEQNPTIDIVFGARVKLLGKHIERSAVRHYPGRIFATLASFVLGLAVYDTQCGAKLFRANSHMKSLFAEPFITKWLFDVEIIARLINNRRGTSLPQADAVIYESPLSEWRDVAGSKVKAADFAKALIQLWRIRKHYLLD